MYFNNIKKRFCRIYNKNTVNMFPTELDVVYKKFRDILIKLGSIILKLLHYMIKLNDLLSHSEIDQAYG